MKIVLISFILAFLFSKPLLAVQLTIQNPCSPEPWLKHEAEGMVGLSVGQITTKILGNLQEPFVGSEGGVNSIRGMPMPDQVLEILSSEEMRAYGWCYHVDGVEPGLMPDQVKVAEESASIYWFLAYAEYSKGTWISMCVPTHQSRPASICR
jgi:hypothetical protein